MGRTLTHEHLALDFNKFYVAPPSELEYYLTEKINLQNIGFVKQYPYSSRDNVNFNDTNTNAAVFTEVRLFKKFGGGTIVENTSHGIKRDIALMKKVSEATGVHIIVGTGKKKII